MKHVLLPLMLLWALPLSAKDEAKPKLVYSVDKYDPKRDPEADLKKTVELAKKDKRRILMIVGGNWCGWCRRLDREFKSNDKVAAALAKSYVIMKVNMSDENSNLFFLQDYPDIPEYPHFYVLDAKGKLLHSQPNRKLEGVFGYREKSLLGFLNTWATKQAKK